MEKGLDSLSAVLQTLIHSGSLRYNDLVLLASPKIGSATTTQRTIANGTKLGFIEKRDELYSAAPKGRKLLEALETTPNES